MHLAFVFAGQAISPAKQTFLKDQMALQYIHWSGQSSPQYTLFLSQSGLSLERLIPHLYLGIHRLSACPKPTGQILLHSHSSSSGFLAQILSEAKLEPGDQPPSLSYPPAHQPVGLLCSTWTISRESTPSFYIFLRPDFYHNAHNKNTGAGPAASSTSPRPQNQGTPDFSNQPTSDQKSLTPSKSLGCPLS